MIIPLDFISRTCWRWDIQPGLPDHATQISASSAPSPDSSSPWHHSVQEGSASWLGDTGPMVRDQRIPQLRSILPSPRARLRSLLRKVQLEIQGKSPSRRRRPRSLLPARPTYLPHSLSDLFDVFEAEVAHCCSMLLSTAVMHNDPV